MAEYSEAIPTQPGHYVYRFWAADGTCLYVGCAGERSPRMIHNRLNKHRRDKPWWPQVVRTDVASFATAQEAVAEECAQISQLKPSGNGNLLGVCVNGHDVSWPGARSKGGACKQCVREYNERYKETHAEQLREYRRRPEIRARYAANTRRYTARKRVIPGQQGLWT